MSRQTSLALLLTVSLLLNWRPRPVAAQSSEPHYVVQAGDTFYDIARQFGLSLAALQAANPGVNPELLSVGQTLVVPGFAGVTGVLGAHVLEPGESLDSLALRLGLKRETLIRLNRVVNPELLFVGESVVVVDQWDGGTTIPTGRTYLAQPDEGWLSLAAARDQNPWALATLNRQPHPGWLVPGQSVVAPGGDQPTTALPFPLVALEARPLPVEQGHTVSIRVVTARPATLSGSLGDWPLRFNVEAENSQYALLGVYRLAEPDLYRLTLEAWDANNPVRFSQPLPVRGEAYGVDPPLKVDPATIDPEVIQPEFEQIQSIVAPFTPVRYWQGVFQLPSVGALRSAFGALRSYNGGPYDTFHTGADFSGAEDRPITAPAPGRVVFTGALTVRGNATVIDHGWGVYTGYWHQSSVQVQTGQRVETGQIIGYQGATGRATGPHLHWELWVGGFQVDPLQWTNVEFP